MHGMSDLTDDITTAASNPKTVKSDGTEVTQHAMKDLIDADRHNAGQTAGSRSKVPIAIFKTKPPGAT